MDHDVELIQMNRKNSDASNISNSDRAPLKKPPKKWYHDPDSRRLFAMSVLTLLFAIMEFIVGIITSSLALLADASHMLSDQFALTIGFAAIQIKKRDKSHKYSYGWGRAEVIGALFNGVFLFSASLYILLEAIERFIEPPDIKHPVVLISAASAGLFINIIGLFIFIGHRSGHGHSHGHGGHGHSHGHTEKPKNSKKSHSHSHGHSHEHNEQHDDRHDETTKSQQGDEVPVDIETMKPRSSGSNLNMHGVFLHVLGDCLGSIGAILSGLGIWLLPWKHRFYLDPICSVFITCIILKSSIPLIKACVKILMQSVPEGVNLEMIQDEIRNMDGILGVHELHVWQLADTKIIGTVHIGCKSDVDFLVLATSIKQVLHKHGVHSSTIQPEFYLTETKDKNCALSCTSDVCGDSMCCVPRNTPLVERRKFKGKVEIELP